MKNIFKFFILITIVIIFSKQNSISLNILPLPQKVKITGKSLTLNSTPQILININDQEKKEKVLRALNEILVAKGIKNSQVVTNNKPTTNTVIILGKVNLTNLQKDYQQTNWKILGVQGYRLFTKTIGKQNFIVCVGNNAMGIFYGMQTLRQIINNNGKKIFIPEIDITDYPNFKIRGILEGGYGGPWPHKVRMNILKFMAENKMNIYIYGPKGDKLIRDTWRTFYTEEQLKEFKEEIDFAKKNFIEYGYVLSPVKNVQYTSEGSFNRMVQKYEQLYNIGVRNFAIFFDDIPEIIPPQDAKMFKYYAEAHIYITNKLYEYFQKKDKSVKFSFCPTHYSGLKNTPYLQAIKAKLNKNVIVGWTGPDICSKEITSKQTQLFNSFIGSKAGLGDNYPIAGSWGLGPVRNRSKDLYKYSDSFTSNPLSGKPEASKLALYTIADYSWNSENYNPDKSFNIALQKFSNPQVFPYLKIFCEHFAWAPTGFQKPATLKVLRDKFWQSYLQGKLNKQLLNKIIADFKFAQLAKPVLEKHLNNPTFLIEMAEPLNKFQQYADSGVKFFNELKTKPISKNKNARVALKDKIEKTLYEFVKEELRIE